MISYSIDHNIAVIRWNMTTVPLNVLNDDSIPQFVEALDRAYADEAVTGIIITSDKAEFVVGADLKMMLRNINLPKAEVFQRSKQLSQIFRKMETCGKPVVAAINGTALGGGLEITLACHYRVALNNPKTKLGLPEVKVGLLSGAGGTQRLPRMIGMQAALPLMVEGKDLSVQEALGMGIIDAIAETPDEMMEKARNYIAANPKPVKAWDEIDRKTGNIKAKDNAKIPNGAVYSPIGAQVFSGGTAMMMDKTKGNYPAPTHIMEAVYEGLLVNIDRGLEIEVRHFAQLATSKEAGNLIRTMFLGLNEANKGASRPKDQAGRGTAKTDVKKLGILGAGMMGAGIAYVSALAGIEVVLKDVTADGAERGKDYSRALLKKAADRGKMNPLAIDGILNLIKTTADAADLQGCDLIIEAVFEKQELKAIVAKEAEPMLAPNGVFGSNTSTLPISGLAQASANPANFIGIHFFSPVDKMQLVEIIMGEQTTDYALTVAIDYTRKIKKTPIVVNDSRGFYTSRCFGTYTAEGMELLKDGVNPVLIENAGKLAGMPVGPLAVHDEVALDLSLKVMTESIRAGVMSESEPTYQMVKQFNELGRIGKKAKAGFYDYPADAPKHLWPVLAELFPVAAEQPALAEVKTRLLYRQAIEAVRCFEEGVIRTKLDADLGSILAWGFPAYTGGALSFVEFVGAETFVSECDRLADHYGERFRPTAGLRARVKQTAVAV